MSALTLSRRPQEEVLITLPDGRTIEIKNLGHSGPYTKIRIEAPSDVMIDRKEVAERKAEREAVELV